MVSVKDQLLSSLKDLGTEDLKAFQWQVITQKYLTTSEMEDADRHKTVDKLVACFGKEAVMITVKILRKIKQNNLAELLENDHKPEADISVDQLTCPVCLDLLKDPVTIPCGHCYCMKCISDCWDQEDQKGVYRCPVCKRFFATRPVLSKNVEIAEIVEKLKKTGLHAAAVPPPAPRAAPADPYTGSGDVQCDSCTGRKQKALRSCLECRSSYCQIHPEQHESLFRGNRHNLMDATGRLQETMCPRHGKMLEIYCRTDQRCICVECFFDEHKNHDTVSTADARTEKQRYLESQTEHQRTIQKNEKDIKELREAAKTYKRSAQMAVEDSERIFTELICSIESRSSEVTQLIRDQERAAVSQVEERLERLKQEIDDLRRSNTELEKLSHTQDHVYFLQTINKLFQLKKSLSTVSLSGSTDGFTVSSRLSFDDVVKSVSQLSDEVQKFCSEETQKIFETVNTIQVILTPEYPTREEFLQYFHQFTLDLNSVHTNLHLSEGNTAIAVTNKQCYPEHLERFNFWFQALCDEVFTGPTYWEVEWVGDEVGISVAYKSINRKSECNQSRFGHNDQSWRLACLPDYCSFWHNNIETKLPVVSSRRVGVYVDHSARTLSFYSVSDTMSLIHRVQTTFTQPLCPGIGLAISSIAKLSHL